MTCKTSDLLVKMGTYLRAKSTMNETESPCVDQERFVTNAGGENFEVITSEGRRTTARWPDGVQGAQRKKYRWTSGGHQM